MSDIKEELDSLEKIEKEEEEELKAIFVDFMQDDKHDVSEIYSEVEKFVTLNQRLVKLTEYLYRNPENFIDIYEKITSVKNSHEEIEKDIISRLEGLDVPDKFVNRLHQTDKRLEELDEEVINDIKKRRKEHAEKILKRKPTIYFDAKALKKFIKAVKENQIEKGAEVPGIFGFEKNQEGFYLKKFLKLENTNPRRASFNLAEQVNQVIEEYGNDRNIIVCHSHPPRDFEHSSTDKEIISQANSIGVIGVPNQGTVYSVPEKLDENNRWTQLPSKVLENGNVLENDELKDRFYSIWDYNQALKEAIISGNEIGWTHELNR